MVTRALALAPALALALGACFDDSYRCEIDADCDVEGGRCERDGRCTRYDATCPTRQAYTEHSGDLSNTCFSDAVAPANPCAPGQPPAPREGCFADVCLALPACCDTAWSEACVQDAQLRCRLTCETRIAVTASNGGALRESWLLTWDGSRWLPERSPYPGLTAWLAPAYGQMAPRLAGITLENTFVVGATPAAMPADRDYQAITSVDFNRDARDTVALAYQSGAPVEHFLDIVDLGSGRTRTFSSLVSTRLAWGDDDHDAFPDGLAGAGNGFRFLVNDDPGDHLRSVSSTKSAGVGPDPTPGTPALRGFDWIDLDGDKRLDAIAFGSSLRVHLSADKDVPNMPTANLDCEPPVPAGQCAVPESASYAAVALPSVLAGVRPAVAVATFESPAGGRNVYLVSIRTRDPLALDIVRIDACPACQPFIALAARALDTDQQIDLVGIDTRLQVWTALSTRGFAFTSQPPLTGMMFNQVLLSTTGAPR